MHLLMKTTEVTMSVERIWVFLGTVVNTILRAVQVHHDYTET